MIIMPSNQRTPILYAEFTAIPGKGEKVADLLRDLSIKVRSEPGNVLFLAHREADNSDRFFIYETFIDSKAFAYHVSADYGIEFNRELESNIIEGRSQLTWLNIVE